MNLEPVTVNNPTEVALVAPFMLGYWPERSVCVVVVDGDGRVLLIMRWHVEAPEVPPHLPLADDAQAAAFHLVVFADSDREASSPWQSIASGIADRGIPLGLLLVVERDGDGIRVRVAAAGHESALRRNEAEATHVTAELVAEIGGRWDLRAWAGSREDYVGDITPDPIRVDEVAALVRDARVLDESGRDDAISLVCDTLVQGRITAESIARVLVCLADVRVRDTVLWDLMHCGVDVWSQASDSLAEVVAGAPDEFIAPPATILAILRWQQGDGSRAAAAVERALEADPHYSLADLINRSLLVGLHPGVWAEGLVDLTREACRRSA